MRNFRVFKKCQIICYVWLVLTASCFEANTKSVDISKVKKSPYTSYIQNIVWPSKNVINEKQISSYLIPDEISDLKHYLSYMLKPEYIPPNDIVDANTIALTAYRDNHDFMFLEYDTKEAIIQVVDYIGLTVLYSPKNQKKVDPADKAELSEYVKLTVIKLVNYPTLEKKQNEPEVFISSINIGSSKCGSLYYPADKGREWFWYSTMLFWSDGKDVLFSTGKIGPDEDLNLKRGASSPSIADRKPRKFKKAKKQRG